MFKFNFEAMGTMLEIPVFDHVTKILEEKIKSEIFDFTVYYDEEFSRFKENSLITKISKSAGIYEIPEMLKKILDIYSYFYKITDEQMNPLVGNTLSDLGYDANYTLQKKSFISQTPDLLTTINTVKERNIYKLETKEKVLIDIGALGKGFWVDQVKDILERNMITHFLVNGSGDIFYTSPGLSGGLKVGLEDSTGQIVNTVEIKNQAICGSGTFKRNWSSKENENMHHIINAKTGSSTDNIESVWIKLKSDKYPTTYADALATAIFFVEPESLQESIKKDWGIDFDFYIIYTNKKSLFSKNFF